MGRDIFVSVVAGVITAIVLSLLGVVTGHWHFVLERNQGSLAMAALEVAWYCYFVVAGALFAYLLVRLLFGKAPGRWDWAKDSKAAKVFVPLLMAYLAVMLLYIGGHNLHVLFTDAHRQLLGPTDSPQIVMSFIRNLF